VTDAAAPRRRRLGVVGTFVWDVIHGRDVRTAPVEEWGGIAYALGALDAALPDDWEIVPVIKVGADLWPRALEYLRSLRRSASDASLVEVPYPNNRVELFYYSSERRSEVLHGGVPGWTWPGLAPVVAGLDALLVNFISGFEMDLETAQLLRQHYKGVIYADLHSLTLAVQPGGLRTQRPLPDVAAWCRCFDFVQVNEDELAMMAPDPMALAATALANGVRCLSVTLGRRGAVYFAQPDYDGLAAADGGVELAGGPARASARAAVVGGVGGGAPGPVRTALVPAAEVHARDLDPTGCGDVWGATHFSRLLAGDSLESAIAAAHRAAARNVEHRGATGLASHLRGEIGAA
jgi:sugar/nucleoside kinase (ribokinase family)